jgi:putative phosphoribosyl transferase
MLFHDRHDAGRRLADTLTSLLKAIPARGVELGGGTVVLGIPRGGILVAAEVARGLNSPLDVYLTHKLGAPGNPELALGAVATDGTRYLNDSIVAAYAIPKSFIEAECIAQLVEIRRREALYRRDRPPLDIEEQWVILVDDGIATGATVMTALHALRGHRPRYLILAAPVAPADIVPALARECDEVVLLASPEMFYSVGHFYEHFDQTTDAQVIAALHGA